MTTLTNDTSRSFPGAERANMYIEGPETPPEDAIEPTEESTSAGEPTTPVPAAEATVTEPTIDPLDDSDLGILAITTEPRLAQKGLRGLLGKLGVKVAPGTAEATALQLAEELRRDEEVVRQATWTRAVSILVANPKGGVGKTPTSLVVGGTLAAIRGGSVCIMEVSDDPGALTFRSEGRPTRGLGELVREADTIRTAGQLAGYTAPQTSFASVIGSIGSRPRLDGDSVTSVANVVDEYFAIRVMDSGNQPSSSAFQAAADTADVLVVPIFNAGDAALEAAALLDILKAAGDKAAELAQSAIVVRLHDGRPENDQVVSRVDRILASYGIKHVHTIRYDPHIAERGQITLSKLSAATRHAFTGVAADVVRTLQHTVR